MLAFIDKRAHPTIKKNLSKYFEVIDFETKGITYDAVSCHPDIFLLKLQERIYIPKNLPDTYLKVLENTSFEIIILDLEIGGKYPQTALLNIATNEQYIIHNLKITPKELLDFPNYKYINVNQGYSRCSIIPLNDFYITSDRGVYNTLISKGLDVNFVDNDNIILEGYDKGFIGGTCGIWKQKIFLMGSLKYYNWGTDLRNKLEKYNYEIIELYDGLLFDGGTIMFL